MRLSVTTIESFRLWRHPDQEWMSEDDLLATIRGEFHPNRKVLIGQAFGAVLETPDRYRVSGGYQVPCRGVDTVIELSDDVMQPALMLVEPGTVFEAKAMKRYGRHDVVARADQMVGARLIETKATLSSFDFDKYAASCQWRFMVDIFQPVSVTYHVACLSESEATGAISLRAIETFRLYPYAGLHQDCADLVAEFAEYVECKGLTSILDQRQQEAA